MTPATEQKRKQFNDFIQRVLAPEPAVKGVVGIGSIATGHMRSDSDVDAVVFFDPLDCYIVPAEAIWRADDNTFHSIFDNEVEGLPVDFLRLDWQEWSDPDFEWPEGRRAELAMGWVAFDPSGELARLIAERTTYRDDMRLERLDEAIIWLDQHLSSGKPQAIWDELGPAIAHDRLQAAYDYLVQALFAYNRQWRVWRNREMDALLSLAWLPKNFQERVLVAANAPSLNEDGYQARVDSLRALFNDLLEQLIANGDYSPTPIDQAFIRRSEEPGRSWNMDEWNKFRRARRTT
ncbi:MAG TPA: nucleotidyltransferase domain-containing protein [Anaerolineae bacterium]